MMLRIGTRGSELALWQARAVAARLERLGRPSEIVVIKTTGDKLQHGSLSEAGGRRLFVREIEDALLAGRVDVAVHSAKDMPSDCPDALVLAAAMPREDPRDALILAGSPPPGDLRGALARLPLRPAIGTSSIRRTVQLSRLIAGGRFLPLRGNVDTRLRKLDNGFDAIVLAAAGLKRLGFQQRITTLLPIEECIPAPGQGVVAIQIRREDAATAAAVRPLNDPTAFACLEAERALVAILGGGCQLPLGAIAIPAGDMLTMRAVVTSVDGAERVTAGARSRLADAVGLGRRVGEELAAKGADRLLHAIPVS